MSEISMTIKKMIRFIIPASIRMKIYNHRNLGNFRDIIKYCRKNQDEGMRYQNEIDYLRKSGMRMMFPYQFSQDHLPEKIDVFHDDDKNMKYVIHNEKRLYYPEIYGNDEIRLMYNDICLEQEQDCPHRYFTESFSIGCNDIFVDTGAAEGRISLDAVTEAKEVIIFESDHKWIQALQETFKPWKEKVTIVNKIVSDRTDGNHIKLDDIIANRKEKLFIKVDVEGNEKEVLKGAERLLAENSVQMAVCTYHHLEDSELFEEHFSKLGYSTEFSKGYMILWNKEDFFPPYFRRGVIRAFK